MALREIILSNDSNITEAWKYRMPFFCYKGKMFCYLWIDKKLKIPYIGVMRGSRITHPQLITTNTAKVKKMMIDPEKDIPLEVIHDIFKLAKSLYK